MKQSIENLYQLDGRVPLGKALPFGLQHVLAMFVSNITPIMILASVVGLDSAISAALIQNCMVIAGIGTLVQLFPVWRIGSRLPIVMGISFTFLSLAISIAGAYGMGTLIGAVIIGGLVEGVLGLFVKYWIKRRTRQTLWRAVQMLTQKLCCQTIHDCPKVVPLHYESE